MKGQYIKPRLQEQVLIEIQRTLKDKNFILMVDGEKIMINRIRNLIKMYDNNLFSNNYKEVKA